MDKKDFNKRICYLKQARNGNYMSKVIDKEVFDAFQEVEVGCRLAIKLMPAGSSEYHDDPWAILEFLSKENVDEYNSRFPRKDDTSPRSASPSRQSNAAGNSDDVI